MKIVDFFLSFQIFLLSPKTVNLGTEKLRARYTTGPDIPLLFQAYYLHRSTHKILPY